MTYSGCLPTTFYGETDAELGVGQGVVYWIVPVPSSGDWELRIRDGSDDGSPTIMRIIDKQESSRMFHFDPPLPFERGLYVHMTDDMLGFVIAYDFIST